MSLGQRSSYNNDGGWISRLLLVAWSFFFLTLLAAGTFIYLGPDPSASKTIRLVDTALIVPLPSEDIEEKRELPEVNVSPPPNQETVAGENPSAPAPLAAVQAPASAEEASDAPVTEAVLEEASEVSTGVSAGGSAEVTPPAPSPSPAPSPEEVEEIASESETPEEINKENNEEKIVEVIPAVPSIPSEPTSPPADEPAPALEAETVEPAVEAPSETSNEATQEQTAALPGIQPGQPNQLSQPTQPSLEAALPPIQPPSTKAAWQQFAMPHGLRPGTPENSPKVAVVITGLGLADSATEAAIKLLPPAVTLSFTPYARNLQSWIALARAHGHEVLLDLPMEPLTFPVEDPGPHALLTTLPPSENEKRLEWILERGSAYVGVTGAMGSRFTTASEPMTRMLRVLKERGLLYLDNRPVAQSLGALTADRLGVPRAINNRLVDERQASRIAIDARLAQVERVAKTEGSAVAMAQPFPVSLERVSHWIVALEQRGISLVPITAIANKQKLR